MNPKPYNTVWNTCLWVWLLLSKDTMSSCSWSKTLFYLPANPCYVCIYSSHICCWKKWRLALWLSNQQCSTFNMVLLHLVLVSFYFFKLVTLIPIQLGTRTQDYQFQRHHQNLEIRWWSPWALSFSKMGKRKRNHLQASAYAASTSSWCISNSSLHGVWACKRDKMVHQLPPV